MSATILLIRHGETAWNREKRFRGMHDVPLNDLGRHQAGLLATALSGRVIDAAYTSPLIRARQTAAIALAGRDIEPIVEDGLKDIDYGLWTGLTDDEVARRWPAEHEAWITKAAEAQIPGGEMLRAVYDRAFAAMEAIASRYVGRTVALFAHRVVNKLLVLGALGLELDRFPLIRQDNCCVDEFERIDCGYVIRSINDVGHIRQADAELLGEDF